jgi:hypothetical protein
VLSVPDPDGVPLWLPRIVSVLTCEEFPRDQGERSGAVVDTMVQPLQLAVDEERSVASAAPELRCRASDEAVLRRVRTNVSKIMSESSSAVIERAAAIIDGALSLENMGPSEFDHIATCGWPYDSPCPRCYPSSPCD